MAGDSKKGKGGRGVRGTSSYATTQEGVTRRAPNGGVTDKGPVGTAVGSENPLASHPTKMLNVYTGPNTPQVHAFQHDIPVGTHGTGIVRMANTLQARETGVGTGKYTLVNQFSVAHPRGGKTMGGEKVFGRNLSLSAARRKASSILSGGRAGVDEAGQIFTSDKPVRSRAGG